MIITRAMSTQQTAITGVLRRITAGQEIKGGLCRGPGSGPDRNGSRAAEPNEFDAGNVRGPDRGTRGRERRVEDPGGGPGSATADQLAELLESTVHGRTRTARDPVAAQTLETQTRRAGRPPRTNPGPGIGPGRGDPPRTVLLPRLRIRPHRRRRSELFPPAGLRYPADQGARHRTPDHQPPLPLREDHQ